MIDIQITNDKLEDRAARILMEELNIDLKTSIRLLGEHKSIRAAIKNHKWTPKIYRKDLKEWAYLLCFAL